MGQIYDDIKPCFAFLVKDKLNKESIWKDFFEAAESIGVDYKIIVHAYSGKTEIDLPHKQVETVETSWEKTVPAHFQLFEEFVSTDCTHFILLSESCIPVVPVATVIKRLVKDNGTKLTPVSVHKGEHYKPFFKPSNNFRKVPNKLWKKGIVFHEQWVIYNRKEVNTLLSQKGDILDELAGCGADNEITATYLENIKIDKNRWWYCDWSNGGRHPKYFRRFDCLQAIINDSLFARKIQANCDVINLPDYKAEGVDRANKIGVFLHMYHEHTWRDIKRYFSVLEELSDLYDISYHFSITDGVEYRNDTISEMEKLGTINSCPNEGYDIKPFLLELKKHQPNFNYDYVYKIHSKGKDRWRNKLLLPLFKDKASIIKNLHKLNNNEVWALGARRYLNSGYCEPSPPLDRLLERWDVTLGGERPQYISGTMYILSKEYANYLVSMDIQFDKFEEGKLDTCVSHTHAWEFFFGILLHKLNKRLIGV